jgi:hypothetical protein
VRECLCALLLQGDCTNTDPYFDYAGAVRCLFEDAGDVAFTKHSTVQELVKGGANTQPWSTLSAVRRRRRRRRPACCCCCMQPTLSSSSS